MKLNFSCFRSLTPNDRGRVGTRGTTSVHEPSAVPAGEERGGGNGDKPPASEKLSPVSPHGRTGVGTQMPAICAGVLGVPGVPTIKMEGDDAEQDFDPLDSLRPLFVAWFDANVQLDAMTLALRQPTRWYAGVNSLYSHHCGWMFDHHQGPVPPTLPEFRHLLQELCFEIRMICGEECLPNIALKEDADAAQAIHGCSPLRSSMRE